MSGSGVNKVILVGNLGRDPEFRETKGDPVCTLSLATNESWWDAKQEKRIEHVEWHRVVVWGKRASVLKKYAKKGTQLYVEGKLRTRSYEDKEGVKKYTTEVKCSDFQFLGSKDDVPGGGGDDPGPENDPF